jgi:flagellar biosynthesis GTPase FlhF
MPEVRRRRVAATKPVSRRRDRAAEVEEDEDELEDEDTDAAAAPVRARRTTKKAAARRPPVEDEDDEEEDEEEEDEEGEEEDEDEEEAPAPRARRRRPRPDDDEEEEEESRPRKAAAKKAAARPRKATSKRLPPGIHVGAKGAEEINKGGASNRITLTKDPQLIKCLENAPFVSFRQHWASMPGGGGDRPYTCIEEDCPLCALGDSPSKTNMFNVLLFTEDAPPEVKILQVAVRAYNAFKDTATPKGKENPVFTNGFFAVNRSGKGQQTQTNFKPVKLRDIEEDWEELLENFDPDPEVLKELVAEARESLFDYTVVQPSTPKQLLEVAKYLASDDDEDED